MKHTLQVTLLLLLLFLSAQIVGLFVVKYYLPAESKIMLPANIVIEKPQMDEKTSYLPIFIAILIATFLALILIKFEAMRLWKLWFFISVVFTLTISFQAFIPKIISPFLAPIIAFILAVVLAIFKVFKPNVFVHNLTEVFIYGALAAIFVPVMNVVSISILLVLISIYDMIAVWKTRHMIAMAKFQTKSKMFTGLLVPYRHIPEGVKPMPDKLPKNARIVTVREAILGGGDIAFPLLFAGVILKYNGFFPAVLISLFAGAALFLLFMFAEKKKFYPAMPFISAGCFLGYLVLRLFVI